MTGLLIFCIDETQRKSQSYASANTGKYHITKPLELNISESNETNYELENATFTQEHVDNQMKAHVAPISRQLGVNTELTQQILS